jgi:hypothetical protein
MREIKNPRIFALLTIAAFGSLIAGIVALAL